MDCRIPELLFGAETHGFRTLEDLDVRNMFNEARTRWLRPNEIHAVLCNHNYFSINVKPVNLPKSGTIVLFDRKMLRNFRKDGHNWKKKKDGKTVKEAHEHLKVGDEERIHVYYAHGEDSPTFVRRCYWLLDKKLEHIVLVHYRETQEMQASPVTPLYSNSSSTPSDQSNPGLLTEENDSGANCAFYGGDRHSEQENTLTLRNHAITLHEINTLEWEDLLESNDQSKSVPPGADGVPCFKQPDQYIVNDYEADSSSFSAKNMQTGNLCIGRAVTSGSTNFDFPDTVVFKAESQTTSNVNRKDDVILGPGSTWNMLAEDNLQTQTTVGSWINCDMTTTGSLDNSLLENPTSACHDSLASPRIDQFSNAVSDQIFSIMDVSPAWAFSSEETKILVIGWFHGECALQANHGLHCVCGDACVPVEIVQAGVLRCLVPPHAPGLVDFFISFDGHKPVSQMLNFEYRSPLAHDRVIAFEDKSDVEEFQVQMRLASFLFSSSRRLNLLCNKVSVDVRKEAQTFAKRTSHIANTWANLIKSIEDNKISFPQVKGSLFEFALKNRLQEWLLDRICEGGKITDWDDKGRGVIHLCAILGYTWAAHLFSRSGMSLDYRDKNGWTALHWAAYCGREGMVAALISAGAKLNLVTDPTSENPGGLTAADLASKKGHNGLGAYLAEKALVEHFRDMTLAGNVSGSLQISTADPKEPANLSEDELYLKDTLAAYRTAADAAARIQTAFREHSLKLRTKMVESSSPEAEARCIVAAMKIQHAFRNYETRKKIVAAARIQYRFRTWKIRKEFLNMRRQAIKIQAAFRGYQVRRQYHKIVWSVGVLEKAILRWRLKRKGFRGLQVNTIEVDVNPRQESDAEEDFFRASRKQAEERVERAVVRVQAMFRSKQAQQDYRRMKLAVIEAKLDYEEFADPELDMDM